MGLLYYLPNEAGSITLEKARAAGLGYAFDRPSISTGQVPAGPGDASGVIFFYGDPPAGGVAYRPEAQTWRKIPGLESGAWVGRVNAETILPESVARAQQLDGHQVELGDGQQWLVPIALAAPEDQDQQLLLHPALPRRLGLDDAGQWQPAGPILRYEPLWQAACKFWEGFRLGQFDAQTSAAEVECNEDDSCAAAITALAANYRLGPAEVDVLGLFDEQCIGRILLAMIDWDGCQAWLEKKTREAGPGSESCNIGAGPAASTGVSAPA